MVDFIVPAHARVLVDDVGRFLNTSLLQATGEKEA